MQQEDSKMFLSSEGPKPRHRLKAGATKDTKVAQALACVDFLIFSQLLRLSLRERFSAFFSSLTRACRVSRRLIVNFSSDEQASRRVSTPQAGGLRHDHGCEYRLLAA